MGTFVLLQERTLESDMDKESLELLLDQGLSVEKVAKRFGKDPSTISYWMGKYGLHAVNRETHAAKGGIERDPSRRSWRWG
jgi:transposase